jgi:hypothetical protein
VLEIYSMTQNETKAYEREAENEGSSGDVDEKKEDKVSDARCQVPGIASRRA